MEAWPPIEISLRGRRSPSDRQLKRAVSQTPGGSARHGQDPVQPQHSRARVRRIRPAPWRYAVQVRRPVTRFREGDRGAAVSTGACRPSPAAGKPALQQNPRFSITVMSSTPVPEPTALLLLMADVVWHTRPSPLRTAGLTHESPAKVPAAPDIHAGVAAPVVGACRRPSAQ